MSNFKRLIIDPLLTEEKDPCQNLRILLKSMCLRRKSQPHSKLSATHEKVSLSLSMLEKSHYEETIEQTKRHSDVVVSTGLRAQRFARLFTVILRLRMLCNHGTCLDSTSSPSSESRTPQQAGTSDLQIKNDMDCEICRDQDSSDLVRDLDFCPSCTRRLQPSLSPDSSQIDLQSDLRPRKRLRFSNSSGEDHSDQEQTLTSNPTHALIDGSNYAPSGYSTKLRAVAENLFRFAGSSKRSFYRDMEGSKLLTVS